MTKRKIIRILKFLGYGQNSINSSDWSHPSRRGSVFFKREKKVNYVTLGWNSERERIEELEEDDFFGYIVECNPDLLIKIREYKLKTLLDESIT